MSSTTGASTTETETPPPGAGADKAAGAGADNAATTASTAPGGGESPAPDDRPAETSAPWWRRALGPFVILATVVLANLPPLIGLVDSNPLGPIGATGAILKRGFLPGQLYTDPSVGWVSFPLGHLAAMDWLHGIVPWWNPYEGLGAPLAAAMQSGAFFPPTLLMALPNGQLYFHMTLEAIAGMATYFLVRELGMGRAVSTLGGVLFALNGTFAWFGHAPDNPVAFLPVVLLGVERLARRRSFDTPGAMLITFGLALSFYAGFPEVAYFDGLLALVWFLVRVGGRPAAGRARYALSIAAAAVTGALLAAPLAVPFARNLNLADVGRHAGQIVQPPFRPDAVPVVGLPYLYGPIATFIKADPKDLGHFWAASGGYLTISAITLAAVGLIGGRSHTALRRMLAIFAICALGWQLALPPFATVFQRIMPLSQTANAYRYFSTAWEMSVVLLACFGVDAVANGGRRLRTAVLGGFGVGAAVILADLALAWPTIRRVSHLDGRYHPYAITMIAWAGGMLVAISILGWFAVRSSNDAEPERRRHYARSSRQHNGGKAARVLVAFIGGLLALDALVMFVLPELSAPRSVVVDRGPARFLAAHLANGRYFGLWAYHPDIGSYFQLASIDSNNLPVPKAWATYVHDHLAPNANALIFDGARVSSPEGPSAATQLRQNLANYEAIDVRYVIALSAAGIFGAPRDGVYPDGVRLVWSDPRYDIYSLPHPQAFFRAQPAQSCTMHAHGMSEVIARCDRPITLVRAELDLPGWSVTVNGRPAQLRSVDGGVQGVQLAAGESVVRFSYFPQSEGFGLLAFGLGVVAVVGMVVFGVRSRRRAAPRPEPSASPAAAAGTVEG